VTALELVERKIAGYDELLARGLKGDPPDHRPAPRRVRVRPADWRRQRLAKGSPLPQYTHEVVVPQEAHPCR